MARMTRAQALNPANSDGYTLHALLATLVTATNADGSPYSLPVAEAVPASADVLTGRQSFTATTAATTIITIPAGRTWVGTVWASVSCEVAAASAVAGRATATLTVAGAGSVPAGTQFVVDTRAGANAATGTVGGHATDFGSVPLTVIAPVGNAVTVQVASTNAGTTSLVEAGAQGRLV